MDPLSAVGLAGSVVQFISFAHEIVSLGKEVYKSPTGAIQESEEIGAMLKDLEVLRRRFWGGQLGSAGDYTLSSLIDKCAPIHKELERVLESLQVEGPHRKWKSLGTAVKMVWKKSQIKDVEKRLRRLQRQIDSHLVSHIKSQQAETMEALKDMAETIRRSEINRETDLQCLKNDIAKGFDTLRASKWPSIIKHSEEAVTLSVQQWIPGSRSAIQGSLDYGLIFSLGMQAYQAQTYTAERVIVQSLTFQEMLNRQFEIKEAHLATFEWIFSPSEERPSPIHFTRWLRSGDGFFWISGRPGSGKSTLMKHVYSDSRTTCLLSEWAGTSNLVSASFFFWAAGSPMQRSIKGLLQSLVCQILRQCPALTRAGFPQHWKEVTDASRPTWHPLPQFDIKALTYAIEYIIKAKDLATKFCFFIDGLDEYEGFDRNIAATIMALASSPSVKICVASRPHNVFVKAFGGNPDRMLHVHEFNDWDIRRYIKDILEEDPTFVSRKEQSPEGYQALAEYIRKEANGVFLWVYLVVLNILDGIENGDRMSDLQKKLKNTPTDLKALFTHILNSVDFSYHNQQARMLQIACQAEEPLGLIAYSLLDDEEDDPNFAINCPIRVIRSDDLSRRCEEMKLRVVARCKLLLEVVEHPADDLYFMYSVTFLHRTVRDYLRESEAQVMLARRLTGSFDARRKVCDALLAQVKHVPTSTSFQANRPGHSLVLQLLRQAKEVERLENIALTTHLNSLKSTIDDLLGRDFHWWQTTNEFRGEKVSFLSLIIESGLSAYLKVRVAAFNEEFDLNSVEKAWLLTESLLPKVQSESTPAFNVNTVKILLGHGANPNFVCQEEEENGYPPATPWEMYLGYLETVHYVGVDPELDTQRFLIFEQLILAGANLDSPKAAPQARRSRRAPSLTLEESRRPVVDRIIQHSISPEHAKYLLDLIKRRRQQKKQQNSGFRSWFRWG